MTQTLDVYKEDPEACPKFCYDLQGKSSQCFELYLPADSAPTPLDNLLPGFARRATLVVDMSARSSELEPLRRGTSDQPVNSSEVKAGEAYWVAPTKFTS